MSYIIELGRDAPSFGNVVRRDVFDALNFASKSHPDIPDVLHPATTHKQEASDLLTQLPDDALRWLQECGAPFRIEAVWAWKEAPESFATALIGGDCVTYGYVLNVHLDDRSQAIMFKLAWGGNP